MIKDYINNRSVIILGLGVSGIDVIDLFIKEGIDFIAVDDNDCLDIESKFDIKVYKTSEFLKLNYDVELIVKSPGIKYNHDIVVQYPNAKIINDIELSYHLASSRNIKIIGVTGTNGKTSTTTFITRLLNFNNFKAYSCGNIGTSVLSVLRDYDVIDFLVIELSSFQLKAVDQFTCDYAFLLNFTQDHMDYHLDMDDYLASKLNIVKNKTKSGYFFINEEVKFGTSSLTLLKNNFDLECIKGLNLGGVNPENIKLVYQFCKLINIDPNSIITLLENDYEPLAHRLELVSEINGIRYINDSKATNVEATKSALSQLENVILLVGGYDKGEDMSKLNNYLTNVKKVIAYGDNKAKFDFIEGLIKCETLEDALSIANTIAKAQDTILLSPASASYDQYKNFEQRGECFKELVNKGW